MSLNKDFILALTSLKEFGIKGVGPKTILKLGDANSRIRKEIVGIEDLFHLISQMKEKVFQKITLEDLEKAYSFAVKIIQDSKLQNIGLIGYYDQEYPNILRSTINEDGKLNPPLILWYKGDLSITKLPGIAVIGTREATNNGITGGSYLSGKFAQKGFNIISGLAIGCDTCAHKGALDVGGKTTAILATGLDYESIYPLENKNLAKEIVNSGGLLLSEYPIGKTVSPYDLVARDRLQAGLALATLVVQTGLNGGTMHAANTTLKANKPLYAILFKDETTNNHEKCTGNKWLVSKGAKYIKGDNNIDIICEEIIGQKVNKKTLFD